VTRTARRELGQVVVGAVCCVALTACAQSGGAGSPTPQRSAIDTMTFAPSLEVDISKFTRTRAGSYYRDVIRGTGPAAALNRTLTVKYVISLPNGTVIETQTTPADIVLGESVIRGWRDAIPEMRVGGSRTIVLPPELAYGRAGYGAIPPRATLVFEIELIAVH
jgi:FKBP-type peptidyl-prolyl cis-trans isomerase